MDHIVCIGGGTGLFTVLSGLKETCPDTHLSAVVSMMDSGGSTGRLRDEYGHLPPGDIRRCLVALSHAPLQLRQLMEYRFPAGDIKGHSFGNLLLTAMKGIIEGTEAEKEYGAIQAVEDILDIRGNVYPVTLTNCHLVAVLKNGEEIIGETNIDVREHNPEVPIQDLFIQPKATLFSRVADAILSADTVVIGPGDLYTSILPNLIVDGMAEILEEAQSNGTQIVYVVNTMTKYGETNGYTAKQFVHKVERALGNAKIDTVIVNDGELSEEQVEMYAAEKSERVQNDLEGPYRIVTGDLISREAFARHDPKRLAEMICLTM